jgi:hypothetical protein
MWHPLQPQKFALPSPTSGGRGLRPRSFFYIRDINLCGRGLQTYILFSAMHWLFSIAPQFLFVSLTFRQSTGWTKSLPFRYTTMSIKSTGVWRWYVDITVTILDIIQNPVFYLKQNISKTGFGHLFKIEHSKLGPIYRDSLCLPPHRLYLSIWPNWVGSTWKRRQNPVS